MNVFIQILDMFILTCLCAVCNMEMPGKEDFLYAGEKDDILALKAGKSFCDVMFSEIDSDEIERRQLKACMDVWEV